MSQLLEECQIFCAVISENIQAMPKMCSIMVEDWISPTCTHCWDIVASIL